MIKLQNFIGGEFMPSSSGEYFAALNPATAQVIHEVPLSEASDIDAAVKAAHQAFLSWSSQSVDMRIQVLLKIADEMQKRSNDFANAESQNQGKPLSLAQALDIPMAINAFREAAAELSQQSEKSFSSSSEQLQYIRREPLGVCGLIVPWNFPLMLLAQKIAPAIAVGNCVVCKPSEMTSLTSFLFAKMISELQIPPGIINIVFGDGVTTGAALVRHKDVQGISFTGGTKTGQALASEAIQSMKSLSLEMGGKNPCVIFGDCDQTAAISSAMRSCFLNSGQVCLATSRLFIEKKIFNEFSDKFFAKMKRLNVGDPSGRATFIGPLISEAHRKKFTSYVDQARSSGYQIHCGQEFVGTDEFSKGFFVSPTAIIGAPIESAIMQEEVFGPMVALTAFENLDEVILLANNTQYGLAASIWTSQITQAQKVAAGLKAGTIWVNSWMNTRVKGGVRAFKNSGYGSMGSDFYTQTKAINLQF